MLKNIVLGRYFSLFIMPFAIDKLHPRSTFVQLLIYRANQDVSWFAFSLPILKYFSYPQQVKTGNENRFRFVIYIAGDSLWSPLRFELYIYVGKGFILFEGRTHKCVSYNSYYYFLFFGFTISLQSISPRSRP